MKKHLFKALAVIVAATCALNVIPVFAGSSEGSSHPSSSEHDWTFGADSSSNATEDIEINIDNTIQYVDVAGEKIWKNDEDVKTLYRPENVVIHLYANGIDTNKSVTTGEDENWRYSFSDLDKYSEGEPITYTVKEDAVDNYTASYSGGEADWYDSENEIIVLNTTNTFKPTFPSKFPDKGQEEGKYYVNVKGTKFWNDDDDRQGMRPDSITIHLYKDGVDTGLSTSTDASKDWTYSFDNLEKYDYEGDYHEFEYSVKEDVPEGYTAAYTKVVPEKEEPEKETFPTPPSTKIETDKIDQSGTVGY